MRLALMAAVTVAGVCRAQDADELAVDVTITNPTVRAALERKREAPADYARAVFVLIDVGEPDLAQPIFDELLALNLDDAAKAALIEEFGSARFLRLSRAGGAGSAQAAFASECLAAASARATSDNRLAELVAQLGDPSEPARAAALAGLERAGQPAVRYCVAAMAEANDAQRNRLREALIALGPIARPALVAMLEASDPGLRRQAAWALGKLEDFRSAPLLAAQAVLEPAGRSAGAAAQWAFKQLNGELASTALAARLIDAALADARRGVPPDRPNPNNQITVYLGDAAGEPGLEPILLSVDDARTVHAARLARLRHRLNPADERARRRAMVLGLEAASLFVGTSVSLPRGDSLDPANAPTSTLSAGLREALGDGHAGAAMALVTALGERGDKAILVTADGRPSPLAAALESPHPGVRIAALRSLRRLGPASPFPGSSRVVEALIAVAGGGRGRVAVVATPNTERSATIAGYLTDLGFDARATNRGGEAVELAASADAELVLVDTGVLRPGARETVFRLRRQAASGMAPIAVLAADGRMEFARRVAEEHAGVVAFPRPQSADAVAAIVERLADFSPANGPSVAERATAAAEARKWLAELLADGPSFYGLRSRSAEVRAALSSGAPTAEAVDALALLGGPGSQLELLTLVGLGSAPLADRRHAVNAFAASVDRHGLLLTTDQILQQYNRYNNRLQANPSDTDTLGLLSGVLDAIEKKRRQQAEGSGQ